MFGALANRLYAIMAGRTRKRCHGMVKPGDTPRAHLVAVFTLVIAADMRCVFASRDIAVVTAETIGRNIAVINFHVPPACGVMAVEALVAGGRMIAAFARCGLAVMAGKTRLGCPLEFCTRMTGLAAYIDMFASQRKAGLGVVETFVNDRLRRSKTASQEEQHECSGYTAQACAGQFPECLYWCNHDVRHFPLPVAAQTQLAGLVSALSVSAGVPFSPCF